MDFTKEHNKLFKAAKANDEFEYACALLNFQGMQDESGLGSRKRRIMPYFVFEPTRRQ